MHASCNQVKAKARAAASMGGDEAENCEQKQKNRLHSIKRILLSKTFSHCALNSISRNTNVKSVLMMFVLLLHYSVNCGTRQHLRYRASSSSRARNTTPCKTQPKHWTAGPVERIHKTQIDFLNTYNTAIKRPKMKKRNISTHRKNQTTKTCQQYAHRCKVYQKKSGWSDMESKKSGVVFCD